MSVVYQVTSRGVSPLDLDDLKSYSKMGDIDADDYILQDVIDACTSWGERYTGRDFRRIDYTLLLDCFSNRINIVKDPVDAIDSVEHLVDGAFVAVSTSLYYLKKNQTSSEIVLKTGKDWPTNTDEQEQAIKVTFHTKAYYDTQQIIGALKRHCLYMYMNRGDCDDTGEGAKESGAIAFYNQFRIPRV